MVIKLVCVGKIKEPHLQPAIDEYLRRIGHYAPIEYQEIKAESRAKTEPDEQIKRREYEKIRQSLAPHDCMIALDERGTQYSSAEFAEFFARYQSRGDIKRLVFVTGGATGLAAQCLKEAQHTLSLSRMTFPHQLCRLLFLEQVYRALTILAGESYHKS